MSCLTASPRLFRGPMRTFRRMVPFPFPARTAPWPHSNPRNRARRCATFENLFQNQSISNLYLNSIFLLNKYLFYYNVYTFMMRLVQIDVEQCGECVSTSLPFPHIFHMFVCAFQCTHPGPCSRCFYFSVSSRAARRSCG